jgi:PAS domain S-box-containing protein
VAVGAIPTDELAVSLAGRDDPDLIERLTALLMSADEGFWSLDLRDRSLRVSRSIEVLFGHRASEIGHDLDRWLDLIHPADKPGLMASAGAALTSGDAMWTAEMRFRTVDGSYTLVRCDASILRDATGDAVMLIGSASDVSARVNELAELQRRTHELLDLAAEARGEQSRRRLVERAVDEVVWEWDIEKDEVRFSDAMGTIFGYPPAQVDPTFAWWEEHVHPDDRAGVRHSLAMHLADGLEQWIGTYRFRRADGSYVWVRDRGYVESGDGTGHRRMVGSMSPIEQPQGPAVAGGRGSKRLSPRQAEVLQLVRAGYTNKQIAVRLRMGEQSAKDHVSRLLKILGAPNRAALVAAADDVEIVRDRRSGPRRGSDATSVLYAITRGPEHVLVSASPGVLALTPGRSPLGRSLREAYPELAGQGIFELFDAVYRLGGPVHAEQLVGRVPHRDAMRIVIADLYLDPVRDASGRVDGVLAHGMDVSPRGRADAAPTAGLQRQMQALEDLPVGAVLTDAAGVPITMNEEARRILGASVADGRPIPGHAAEYALRDAVTGRELGSDETSVARALRGEVVSRLDYVLRPPGSDTDVVLRTSAMPVHGPDKVVAVLLTFSEVERGETTEPPR